MSPERGHDLADLVLTAVDLIPSGRVASYGDIADIVGCGPRAVGRVMSRYGHQTCWWRVTSHAGDFAGGLLAEARPHWDAEGIEVKPNGLGCRIAHYRVDLDQLSRDYAERLALLQREGQDAGA